MNKLSAKETEAVEVFMKTGNKSSAAKLMGISRASLRQYLLRAEAKGLAPWQAPNTPIPPHLNVCKSTVHYDGEGNVKNEWRRYVPGAQELDEFVDSLCERVKGKAILPNKKLFKSNNDDILGELDIFDIHYGLKAQAKQTGGRDQDCDISGKMIMDVSDRLLSRFDKPAEINVVFGGDQLHADGRVPATEKSHNILDVDSRYEMVVERLSTLCYDLVRMAAKKAPKVNVIVVPGNHDPNSSVWLSTVLRAFFSECSNVNIVNQYTDVKHMIWGRNLLGYGHGQDIPLKRWGEVIPNMFREEWGRTGFCHVKVGHTHHRRGKKTSVITQQDEGWVEQAGVLAESLPSSCFRDSWHASKGFFGQMVGVAGFEYHKEHGLWSRFYQPVI